MADDPVKVRARVLRRGARPRRGKARECLLDEVVSLILYPDLATEEASEARGLRAVNRLELHAIDSFRLGGAFVCAISRSPRFVKQGYSAAPGERRHYGLSVKRAQWIHPDGLA
jgi:hypothetical protein